MPELPDVTVYVEALERRIAGHALERVRLKSSFLLRTAAPPLASAHGRRVLGVRRMGKRIVIDPPTGSFDHSLANSSNFAITRSRSGCGIFVSGMISCLSQRD